MKQTNLTEAMNASMKIISVINGKRARNGALYDLIYVEIEIAGEKYIRRFALFHKVTE